MSKLFIAEFNCETQEEIIREMTDEEYSQHLIDLELLAIKD